ncbi:TrmH family RNA methyltransferase [Brevibacterium litoralis]|uniref:TrmH family RNA methyltransferase n=1 Tax=Brevibacterium litoralis TaxID=3138935 RepID=UPI0032EC7C56
MTSDAQHPSTSHGSDGQGPAGEPAGAHGPAGKPAGAEEIPLHPALTGPVLSSAQSKRMKGVANLARRNVRQKERKFLAEGPQSVREAFRAAAAGTATVCEAYATAEAADRHADVIAEAQAAGIRVQQIRPELVPVVTDTVASQGVLAVCAFVDTELAQVVTRDAKLVVVLSNVRDPGNAGTALRVADAAGADAVVYTSKSVDVYNPKTVRSTAGSLFHVPVVTGVGLPEVTELGKARGMQILAADTHPPVHDLHNPWDTGLDLTLPTMWVFGNEAWGLPEKDRAQCDASVAIPIYGQAESLNLATAASICIYESARNVRLRD